tara:strand:- start:146 stop:394 length:249 start_codon:yes stop_codon:yes gene_type:complete
MRIERGYFHRTRTSKQSIMRGGSAGSFLLSRGGAGNASSYSSPDEYKAITGMGMRGNGMGGLGALQSLEIRPRGKKPKTIQF